MTYYNAQRQPIGAPVPDWKGCPALDSSPLHGRTCDVVALRPSHTSELHKAFSQDKTGALWAYMPTGPFASEAAYSAWVETACQSTDPLFFTIIDRSNELPIGVASYLRIQPENGVAEVGYITFSPALQRTVMATEAMYLMMKRVFDDLGYRRYEWKCDALNTPSQRAAKRLGFSYDGLFKQALVYKGRNRDTAWFSILDKDWPAIKAAFEAWLDPANFDKNGQQRKALRIHPLGG